MIDRAMIEARHRKKKAEVEGLEEKLRVARAYLAALTDILKVPDDGAESPSDTKLRSGSAVARARDIILEVAAPVHIDDLLRTMGKDVTRDSKASLAGSLAAYVRREDIFSRPAPNTYGLIELGHTTAAEDEAPEIPPSFGGPREAVAFDTDILDEDPPF